MGFLSNGLNIGLSSFLRRTWGKSGFKGACRLSKGEGTGGRRLKPNPRSSEKLELQIHGCSAVDFGWIQTEEGSRTKEECQGTFMVFESFYCQIHPLTFMGLTRFQLLCVCGRTSTRFEEDCGRANRGPVDLTRLNWVGLALLI